MLDLDAAAPRGRISAGRDTTRMPTSTLDKERVRGFARRLKELESPVRVLRTIAWPASVRTRFFAAGCRELPEVRYDRPDTSRMRAELAALKAELTDDPVDRWLHRQAEAIETGARLVEAAGTREFHAHSAALYGTPATSSVDGQRSVLDLAQHVVELLLEFEKTDVGAPPEACHLATGVAQAMERAVAERFGADAPQVEIVDQLSANALAGPRRIRLLSRACFTDKDVEQLVQHEAFVHVATSLNGHRQTDLPILAAGHPGTTRTQEGLAVFAELISGALDLDRMLRLARRVIAIQMSIEGADFLDVYRYFLSEGLEPDPAYESTRRVFRGGLLTGGAPFTKDAVYLDGLLRVHSFLLTLVAEGRTDCLRLLFCGKLDLEDVPILGRLQAAGLLRPARYLPPWADDLRYLLSYLGLTVFLNDLDLSAIRARYADALHETPRLESAGA